jgi:formate/nitrite transporter FocA (FNT family)
VYKGQKNTSKTASEKNSLVIALFNSLGEIIAFVGISLTTLSMYQQASRKKILRRLKTRFQGDAVQIYKKFMML